MDKNASYMKGIVLKAAFSLVFMFDLLFSSLLNFFHVVVFDISLKFPSFSLHFQFKCPEGYLKMAFWYISLSLSHFSLKIAKTFGKG